MGKFDKISKNRFLKKIGATTDTDGILISNEIGGHTQHTDTGTTGNTFTVDSDSVTGKIVVDVALGAANKSLTLTNTALTDNRTVTFKDESGTVAYIADIPPEVGKPVIIDGDDLVFDMDNSIITTQVDAGGQITLTNLDVGHYIYNIINSDSGQIQIIMPTGVLTTKPTYCYAVDDTINAGEMKQLSITYDGSVIVVSLADDLILNAGQA